LPPRHPTARRCVRGRGRWRGTPPAPDGTGRSGRGGDRRPRGGGEGEAARGVVGTMPGGGACSTWPAPCPGDGGTRSRAVAPVASQQRPQLPPNGKPSRHRRRPSSAVRRLTLNRPHNAAR
jgi:hypothetical protein